MDRRRVRDRIHLLEKELIRLRKRRSNEGTPIENRDTVVSIVGYTNAGKSTLFNLLTRVSFTSKTNSFLRWTRPPEIEMLNLSANGRDVSGVVITDTLVHPGLTQRLDRSLSPDFDELKESKLLIHLIDLSNPVSRNISRRLKKFSLN